MKRHTSKPRRHSRQSVLEVRVISPRIVWFRFLKAAGLVLKLACVLALLGGAAWGVWYGIQKLFYKNPDFRLQVIALNANPVIDELGVAAAAGIDLSACPNLFDIDVKAVARKLRNQPAIADARAERHLPETLAVTVTPRLPKAWITCPAAGLAETRRAGAMLVDQTGVAYPCPPLQLESCATLPIIELPASEAHPIQAGANIRHPEFEYCCLLLDAARDADPDALQWIESVRQVNAWSLLLVTRQGTSATFGLGDHASQMESLRAALNHAGDKGYLIETINLIPKYNIPITLREDPAPPPRAIPVSAKDAAGGNETRRARDLGNLLKRN
jgi:hypothetical protein